MVLGLAVALALGASANGEPNWSNSDILYMARFVSTYRTDPGTWASETAFGLRMGMGPADVERRIPAAQVLIIDTSVKEGQVALFDDTVAGANVKVFVHFLRGRLYSVDVSPSSYRLLSRKPGVSAETLERDRKEDWTWTREILKTLSSDLGKPACQPSERTVGRFCFNSAPLPGCGLGEGDKVDKLFRWVWRNGRTETVLTGWGRLEYRDLHAITPVARAKEASKREWTAEQLKWKATERAKLAGAATGPAEEQSPVEDSAEADLKEGKDPPPLECYADPDEPSRESRTAPTSWSGVGWERYRWGMGPADVNALLPAVKEGELFWDPGTREPASYLLLGTNVLSAPSSSTFMFQKERLTSITHQPVCVGTDARVGVDCAAWSKRAESAFNKKCGDGRCTRDGKYVQCAWTCGETEHVSLSRYESGSFQAVSLTYSDPATRPRRAPAGTLKASQSEKSWSAQGWYGFRYGMGPADVLRRLTSAGGDFRARREMACFVSKGNAREVDCTLERDFHEMSVVGLKPTLTFSFLESRLYRVSLKFPRAMEEADFVLASQRLSKMLLEKYGKPTQNLSDPREPAKGPWLAWDGNDLSVNFVGSWSSGGAEMFISYFSDATYRQLKQEGHGTNEGAKL